MAALPRIVHWARSVEISVLLSQQRKCVFIAVCLIAVLHNTWGTVFPETWWKGGVRAREEPIRFLGGSRSGGGGVTFFNIPRQGVIQHIHIFLWELFMVIQIRHMLGQWYLWVYNLVQAWLNFNGMFVLGAGMCCTVWHSLVCSSTGKPVTYMLHNDHIIFDAGNQVIPQGTLLYVLLIIITVQTVCECFRTFI